MLSHRVRWTLHAEGDPSMASQAMLKLQLAPRYNAAFRRLIEASAAIAGTRTTQIREHYDTPAMALNQRGIALCLQQTAGEWQQLLLQTGPERDGLHHQRELSIAIPDPALKIEQFPHGKARRFLSKKSISSTLQPIFTVSLKHDCWVLRDEQDNLLEICLERGKLKGIGWSEQINTVNITLKQGKNAALFAFALRLADKLPVCPTLQDTVAKGCMQAAGNAGLPVGARLPALSPDMSLHQVLQLLVQEILRHLQGNVPGVLRGEEMEYVHQARVALRRLRTVLAAFAAILPPDSRHVITLDVQWLSNSLGQLRDVDVFLTETLPAIETTMYPMADFATLYAALQSHRSHCRDSVHAALCSPRYGTLLLRLLACLHTNTARSPIKLRQLAGHALSRPWKSLISLAGQWETLSQVQRHDLRKRAKRLRYTLEFFSPLLPHKAVLRTLKQLHCLQLVLGKMNDSAVALTLLARLGEDNAELASSVGLVAGWLAYEAHCKLEKQAQVIKKLSHMPTCW
ncbi:CHAD domain-containing protein [Aquitalea denitrificans]|uniref:CYTH and CHAD domain-containing protein n=1 Tax=Aquitalea denitrificans TaxID=519081 RepID=UPI001359ED75|nr:CHAD domain-containing protein [Aquitalea denitrificans]